MQRGGKGSCGQSVAACRRPPTERSTMRPPPAGWSPRPSPHCARRVCPPPPDTFTVLSCKAPCRQRWEACRGSSCPLRAGHRLQGSWRHRRRRRGCSAAHDPARDALGSAARVSCTCHAHWSAALLVPASVCRWHARASVSLRERASDTFMPGLAKVQLEGVDEQLGEAKAGRDSAAAQAALHPMGAD